MKVKEEIIDYRDWRTGEKKKYKIDRITIIKTNLICPFDNTPLMEIEENSLSYDYISCPNCKEDYSITKNQEEINKQARENILRQVRRLPQLTRERKDLEARIKHAKNVGILKSSKRLD
jgi:hypothetical protein